MDSSPFSKFFSKGFCFWTHWHTIGQRCSEEELPSWRKQSVSTALESGRSLLGCVHRRGGQRWRAQEHSEEKKLCQLTQWWHWGTQQSTDQQWRHSVFLAVCHICLLCNPCLTHHFRVSETTIWFWDDVSNSHLSDDPKTPCCSSLLFLLNHLPPDHSGNPGGQGLSSLHPNSDRSECL